VTYRETVSKTSSIPCMSKSPNHHNRLYGVAEPLGDALTDLIERGELGQKDEPKARARRLAEEFKWEPDHARKIWAFGPDATGPNLLVDCTKGIQYMSEIKDSVVAALQWVTKRGVLADENLRGVRFSILDAHLIADAVHRGAGQIIPAAQRLLNACQLTGSPRLVEPVFLVEIQCPDVAIASVSTVLDKRRGTIIEIVQKANTPQYTVRAHLPVAESFGFNELLRAQTSGQAFPQCQFDHWEEIKDDPLEEGTKSNAVVTAIRKRKGLDERVPPLDRFLDKL